MVAGVVACGRRSTPLERLLNQSQPGRAASIQQSKEACHGTREKVNLGPAETEREVACEAEAVGWDAGLIGGSWESGGNRCRQRGALCGSAAKPGSRTSANFRLLYRRPEGDGGLAETAGH